MLEVGTVGGQHHLDLEGSLTFQCLLTNDTLLGVRGKASPSVTIKAWKEYLLLSYIPPRLRPHATRGLAKNPWFEEELTLQSSETIRALLYQRTTR
jgi:hypothetical protein